MAVVIRLSLHGRTHRPFFWVVAIDRHEHREGHFSEKLGTYDPLAPDKNIQVDIAATHRWINQGAILNPSVASLLKRAGYQIAPEGQRERRLAQQAKVRARYAKRKRPDPKQWVPATRRSVVKHKAKLKAERMTKAKAEREAKAAEAPAAPVAPTAPT